MELEFEVIRGTHVKAEPAYVLSLQLINLTGDNLINDHVSILAIQYYTHEKKTQIICDCEDCEISLIRFGLHLITTAKAENIMQLIKFEFMHAQSKDAFGDPTKETVRTPNCHFRFHKN